LPQAETIKVEIFNIIGQKVETLLDERKPAGRHQITFNAENLPSGICIYRMQAGTFSAAKKMVLIR